MLNPQFNGSFVRVSGQMAMEGRLAAGSWAWKGELEFRRARVFGLADLFFGVRRKLHCRGAVRVLHDMQGHRDEAVERAASLGLGVRRPMKRWPLAARRYKRSA